MITCSACGVILEYPVTMCRACGQRRLEQSIVRVNARRQDQNIADTAQPAPDPRDAELSQLRARVTKLEPILAAVEEWADGNEGVPSNANDCGLIKALWTFDGDRMSPCEDCDGECGEPCAPCTVVEAHAMLDERANKFRAERQKQAAAFTAARKDVGDE